MPVSNCAPSQSGSVSICESFISHKKPQQKKKNNKIYTTFLIRVKHDFVSILNSYIDCSEISFSLARITTPLIVCIRSHDEHLLSVWCQNAPWAQIISLSAVIYDIEDSLSKCCLLLFLGSHVKMNKLINGILSNIFNYNLSHVHCLLFRRFKLQKWRHTYDWVTAIRVYKDRYFCFSIIFGALLWNAFWATYPIFIVSFTK